MNYFFSSYFEQKSTPTCNFISPCLHVRQSIIITFYNLLSLYYRAIGVWIIIWKIRNKGSNGGAFHQGLFFSNRPVLDQVVPDESILCKNLNKCLSYEQFNQLSKPYIFHELKLNSFAQQEGSFYYKKVLPFFGLETLLLLDLSIKRMKMKFKLQHFKEIYIKNIKLHILQCDSIITWSPGSMEKKNHVLTYQTVI